jgi:hypothetical protein
MWGGKGLGYLGCALTLLDASVADPTNDQHWHLLSGLRTAPHLRRLTLQIHEVRENYHGRSVEQCPR